MGQAFLDLYAATGNRDWLASAAKAGDFVATFRDEAGGFVTSKTSEGKTGVLAKPAKLMDDQIQVARFMNLLNRYYGNAAYQEQASHAMRYLASASAEMMRPLPGVLLADEELAVEPTHMTIVGHKDEPRAQSLHALARALPARYKRLEWLDLREGKLPNPDVEYPDLGEPAAFACSNHICSYPSFNAEELQATVKQMAKLKPARASLNQAVPPQTASVQLSENASAEVENGRPSRSRGHDRPSASTPLRTRRVPSAGISTVQTP
jgi:uncharacterized protein YyaL (SSP411 family)